MIDINELYEETKHLPRISAILMMRKGKCSWEAAQQILDELLELRFERGIIEDKKNLKYGRIKKG